jgi:hypothetical protein
MARQTPNAPGAGPLGGALVRTLLTRTDMNFRTVFALTLGIFALACGAPPKLTPLDGGGGDGGQPVPDSGMQVDDAGVVADAGTIDSGVLDAGMIDGGAPCDRSDPCTIGWTEPAHFPAVVDHHTSFVHEGDGGAYLYVMGGVRAVAGDAKEVYPAIRRAKINAAGLEAWTDMGALPIGIGFAAQTVSGDTVYLMGGVSMDAMGPFASGKVLIGAISQVDGTITWKQGPSLTETTLHGTAVVLGDKLYLIGGSAQNPKDKVLVSTILADGSLGPWAGGAALPVPRSHHTAVVHGGHIFLVGGFSTNQVPQSPILKSQHDANGALTGWVVAGDMPNSPWTAGASVWGESLFVVGGGEGGQGVETYIDRVRQARFLADNTISGFAEVTPLPAARSHVHQAPIYQGKVYSVGGRLFPSGNSMDRVFVGAFQ